MCTVGEKCCYTNSDNNGNVENTEHHRDKRMDEEEFKVIDEWPVNDKKKAK